MTYQDWQERVDKWFDLGWLELTLRVTLLCWIIGTVFLGGYALFQMDWSGPKRFADAFVAASPEKRSAYGTDYTIRTAEKEKEIIAMTKDEIRFWQEVYASAIRRAYVSSAEAASFADGAVLDLRKRLRMAEQPQ